MSNFETIQKKISDFLQDQKNNFYAIHERHEKLPVSDSIFCAEDKTRNKIFWEAIHEAVEIQKTKKAEVVVVDAGSGTGILGIFALLAGADQVYFLEQNHHSLLLSKRLLLFLGLSKNTQLIHCDATSYNKIPGMLNILISETLSSGFVEEDFPLIIKNLSKQAQKNTIFLPEGFILDIEEQAGNHQALKNYSLELDTKNLEANKKLVLQHKDSHYLKFSMHAKMLGGRMIRSGSTMSFLNPRIWEIGKEHPFFEIEKPLLD